MATSDDLPLQDTDAVNTSLSSVPLQPDESSQTLDNQRHDDFSLSCDHPDPTSESSGLTPLPCQDETIEVLMQPLGQTALLGITRNHPGTDEGDNRDFDTFAIMENDDITNKNSNFDLLYQTSQSPVEMDNMLDINQKETNINEVPLSLYSHFPSLTEHLRPSEQEEMSTTLKQYTSSASLELPINQKGVDAEIPPTDIKSDKMNTEQIPNQPLLIADDAADSYFSSTVPSQTSQDLLSGADLGKSINITYPEMHDIAEDMPDVSSFTTALDPQTPWIPKIEDPQTGDLLSLADLQKADTLNILTVFTQASSLADSVETKNNVWETADVPVTDSSITQTLNNTTTDSLGASTVDCCISVLTQAPQDRVKEVKHDVRELEPCKMVDSVIDRVFDRTFPMQINREVPVTDLSNDPPMDSVTVKNSDTLFQSIHTLPYSISDTPQICERDESNLSEIIDWYIPFASKDLCDSSEVTEGVTLNFKGTERDGEACNELWLDACQFLAGEEDEGAIFDEWGRSRSPSPPTTHPDNTKASDFPRRENTAIDHQAENLERTFPPVERWSSTDSWASALSDWIQIVNAHPEESFTSTNTSGTDLKFSMAIQDPALEQGTSPNITNNTGKTCLSLNLLEPEVDEALSRGLAKSDNTNGPQFEEGDKHRLPSHPDLDKQKNATIENKVNLSETLSESKSDFPEMNAGMDSFNATVSCVHAGNEVNAKSYGHQHITGELWSSELERNVLAEVTGDGLIFKEERESSSHSLKISAYTGEKSLTAECVSAEEQSHGSFSGLHTCPPHSNNHVSSEAEHTCSFAEKNASYMSSNKEELTVNQGKENNTIPQPFIMPFAPLCIGNTFHQHSALSKESRQGNVDLPLKGTESQKPISSDGSSEEHFHTCPEQYLSSSSGESDDLSIKDTKKKTESSKSLGISQELSKLLLVTGERFIVSQDKHVAYITLDLDEPRDLTLNHLSSFSNHINSETQHCSCETQPKTVNMPHKTSKASSDSKTRSKHKEKSADQQHGIQTSKNQENLHSPSQTKGELNSGEAECEDRAVTVIETIVITEKITPKAHGKKKKKHSQHGTAKPENDPSAAVGNKIIQSIKNGKTETLEAKTKANGTDKPASQLLSKMDLVSTSSTQKVIPVKPKAEARGNIVAKIEHDNMDTTEKTIPVKLKTETSLNIVSKMNHTSANATQITTPVKLKLDPSGSNKAKMESKTCSPDPQSTCLPSTPNDDIKRRRIANDVPGAVPIRTRPQLPAIFRQVRKDGDDISRRAYSEVVKQKAPPPKEVLVPRVVSEIQADPVPNDPQNIILWCRFNPVPPDATIKWTKEGSVLSESRKREEDEGRFTLTILKACSKDLGLYKCSLTTASLSVSTSEYHLTSEVLMELVIPSHDAPVEPRPVDGEEESVQCSPLLFREDFLSDQYFGENQPASIVTEQAHFGEGMHRKAFRTTLRTGKLPRFNPGHPCVLKVHNAIGYGTKNNEELVQKNYSLAVEECHVQNTAREYIKAYHSVVKSAESFGEVPEIIPIYLVHRPSNNIPYATLEEELLGDFVKYSVKDGKEINLMRRDSEAGQKCCAFQHWVYTQTEGNLLVTDMQGVGMKLTDVGIATCKKGYKGFRGNCATSFIDQFKALHQCNRYCELLDLTSLQPKPKRTVAPPKPKAQPVPKKKTFGPVLNGKS